MYSQDGIMSLAKAGRNGDTELAHLMVGEVVLPPGTLTGNKRLKNAIEKSLAKTDTSLSDVTVGGDTVSINPYTGLPEFGFLSKLWKKVKKVVDPVAKVARFIPGPWQPIANAYVLGKTAINVAKGDQDWKALAREGLKTYAFTGPGMKSEKIGGRAREFGEKLFGGSTDPVSEGADVASTDLVGGGSDVAEEVAGSGGPFENFFSGDPNYDPTTGVGQSRFGMIEDYIKGLGGGTVGQVMRGLGNIYSGFKGATGIDPAILALAKYYGDATEKALEKQIGGMGDIRDSIRPDLKYDTYGLGGFDLGYAQGGAVLDMRDGGESIGPGTGTSDDIPAMLSDGEFVMTAKANKGAGSVGLKQGKGGIMELSPNMEPDRQRGAKNMMTLMRYFEGLT